MTLIIHKAQMLWLLKQWDYGNHDDYFNGKERLADNGGISSTTATTQMADVTVML